MAGEHQYSNNSMVTYSTPNFDNPPEGPVGVHRGKRSVTATVLPFIMVIVIGVLLGAMYWLYTSGNYRSIRWPWSGTSTSQTANTNQTSDDDADSAESQDAADSAATDAQNTTTDDSANSTTADSNESSTDSSTSSNQSTTAEAAVNKGLAVRVVNATNKTGYAATNAAVLTDAGYTNVEATNPSGSVPAVTTVWYQNASDEATARDVAARLGIATVEQANVDVAIVVVLMQ